MCNQCEPIEADEWLLRRIQPGYWVAAQQRPSSDSFAVQGDELGLSFYRARGCTPDEVLADAPRKGFGLVRVRRAQLPEGIHVVITHPPAQANDRLRMAHVELRYPTVDGGRDLTDSQKKAIARAAGRDNVIVEPQVNGS